MGSNKLIELLEQPTVSPLEPKHKKKLKKKIETLETFLHKTQSKTSNCVRLTSLLQFELSTQRPDLKNNTNQRIFEGGPLIGPP